MRLGAPVVLDRRPLTFPLSPAHRLRWMFPRTPWVDPPSHVTSLILRLGLVDHGIPRWVRFEVVVSGVQVSPLSLQPLPRRIALSMLQTERRGVPWTSTFVTLLIGPLVRSTGVLVTRRISLRPWLTSAMVASGQTASSLVRMGVLFALCHRGSVRITNASSLLGRVFYVTSPFLVCCRWVRCLASRHLFVLLPSSSGEMVAPSKGRVVSRPKRGAGAGWGSGAGGAILRRERRSPGR